MLCTNAVLNTQVGSSALNQTTQSSFEVPRSLAVENCFVGLAILLEAH